MKLKLEEAKIFKNNEDKLVYVKYNPNGVNYFTFIAEQRDKNNLNQIIITSNIMISLIRSLVAKNKFQLEQVEFMIDDESLNIKIQDLVDKSVDDNSSFIILLDKLRFLSDERSVDILKIFLKRRSTGKSTQIRVQANGIFFINESSFQNYAQKLLDIISDSKISGY